MLSLVDRQTLDMKKKDYSIAKTTAKAKKFDSKVKLRAKFRISWPELDRSQAT